jgi:hypothetical protein
MSNKDPGLFITKGMMVSIPEFSLSINENGEMTPNMIIHTGLDMCHYWVEIAYDHLEKTEDIHNQLISAKQVNNEPLMGDLLQKEFVSGMQAIMAGCIAIDSYYASIKDFAGIPESLKQIWREKRTARYKQIAETLKRTFVIPPDTFQIIREILKQSFGLRDMAVHPKYVTDQPVLYPEINKITDWRYQAFCYANAKTLIGHSLSLIYQTARQKQADKKKALTIYCESIVKKLDPTLSKWMGKYGKLF